MFGIYTLTPSLESIAASNVLYNNGALVGSATCISEVNKAGSLEFTIYPTHPMFNKLTKLKTIVQCEMDEHIIFRGRVLNTETDIFNQKTVYCEGDLSFLLDSIQEPGEYEETIPEFFKRVITSHNAQVLDNRAFRIGNVNVGGDDVRKFVIDSYQSTWDVIESLLISDFGGYLKTRLEDLGWAIDYVSDYKREAKQQISFGVNIVDLTEHIPGEDFFTVLLPLGSDGTTIAEVNDGSIYLERESLVNEYGRIVRIQTFNNISGPSDLLQQANGYFEENGEFPYNFQVTAIDLASIYRGEESLLIGDTIRVRSLPHGIDRDLVCKKITYNLLNPERTVYELGKKLEDFSEKYTSGSRTTKSDIQSVKKEQTVDVTEVKAKINNVLNGLEKGKILNTARLVVNGLEAVWKDISYNGSDGSTYTEKVLVGIPFVPPEEDKKEE